MKSPSSTRPSHRRLALASTGLLVLSTILWARHASEDTGVSANDLTTDAATVFAQTSGQQRTGALLIDLVEPEAGEGGSEVEIAKLARDLGAEPAGFYSEGEHLYRVAGTPGQLQALAEQLADHPLVEGTEPEMVYELIGTDAQPAGLDNGPERSTRFEPNDEMFPLQWHMEQIHAPEAWTQVRGEDTIVAVIDTGVAWKDGPGGARQVPDLAGTSFTHGKTFLSNALPDGLDDHLHGTHVAGTISQSTNNEIGVAGVAFESTIMPLKVLSGDGRGSVGAIANAIRYAADNGAHVINMSLGGPLPSRVLAKAVAYAHNNGVTVVCAAGNEKKGRIGYPAAHEGAVAVAATDFAGERTWYSNWGKHLDISAPGGDTRADKNGDGHPDGVLQDTIKLQDPRYHEYMWLQGTSMASPHAAGVAALVVSAGVNNPDEVERILKQTAVHPNNVEWDQDYGAGIIDAAAAVSAAKSDYTPERGGILALLGLGLSGLLVGSASGLSRRRKFKLDAAAAGGAAVGMGLGFAPLAYGLASATGLGFGSPLVMSAALPVLAILSLLGVKSLRAPLAGLALGYAAVLLHGAIVLPTLLTELPGGPVVDQLWLAANAILALWVGLLTMRSAYRAKHA